MEKFSLLLLGAVLLFLPSCTAVGVAAGAGATIGIAAAQEGGLSRAVDDARIQIEINDLWFKYSFEAFRKLDLTINQGRVLVTGVVQKPEQRVEAIRLAWQPAGVKQVINEIQVAESQGIVGFARDTWISARLRTALTFDKDVLSINYSIDTVQGTVYLMGFAQSRGELNRVIETARTISGVNGVVSYVKIVSAPDDTGNGGGNGGQSAWADGRYADEPAAYQGGGSAQAGGQPSPGGEPVVIAPEFQPQGASEPVSQDGPYIIRQEPAVQGDLNAPRQHQGIESEEIIWDQ